MLVTNYTVWELPKEGCEHKQKACCFFLLGCDLRFRTLYPVLGTCPGLESASEPNLHVVHLPAKGTWGS